MEWASVISNPLLQNLPFKIELNKWGKILMSPASNSQAPPAEPVVLDCCWPLKGA